MEDANAVRASRIIRSGRETDFQISSYIKLDDMCICGEQLLGYQEARPGPSKPLDLRHRHLGSLDDLTSCHNLGRGLSSLGRTWFGRRWPFEGQRPEEARDVESGKDDAHVQDANRDPHGMKAASSCGKAAGNRRLYTSF